MRFEDKVVVVTGASRGLGVAMALAFGREGARVFVGYRRSEAEAARVVEQIRTAGGRADAFAIDLRERASVDAAIKGIDVREGRIDVLVNNAGIARDASFAIADVDDLDDVVAVNLGGTIACCRSVARPMLRARAGAIVNVASTAGIASSPGQAAYAASKGGIVALTRTLARELGPKGVRVNCVVPGLYDAGIARTLDPGVRALRVQQIPAGRFGRPEELASAVCFLASDEATYVNGHALVVDGGLTA